MENELYKVKRFLIILGIELLSFLFFVILISSIGLIFKASVHINTIFLSFIITHLIGYLLYYNSFKNRFPMFLYLTSIICFLLLLIASIFINKPYLDFNVDSLVYHKVSVGRLAEGWNPIYEDVNDFNSTYRIYFSIEDSYEDNENLLAKLSVNNYPKALELYAAHIYKLTGDIETGKSFNIVILFSVVLIIGGVLLRKEKPSLVFFTIGIIGSPVIFSQIMTFYIDGSMYLIVSLLVFLLFINHTSDKSLTQLDKIIIYIICIVIAINIKYLSFGYAGAYSLLFYFYDLFLCIRRRIKWKEFIRFTLLSILCVLVGVFIVGLSTYPKNFVTKGDPFYPVFGKNKIDIINTNQPGCLKGSNFNKMLSSMFLRTSILHKCNKKILFSFSKYEISNSVRPDVRIGGFGILFGSLLVVVWLVGGVFFFFIYKEERSLFNPLLIILITTIFLGVFLNISWWARLFPFAHYFLIIPLYLFNKYNKKVQLIPYFIIILLMLIDINTSFTGQFKGRYYRNKYTEYDRSLINEDMCNLYVVSNWQFGTLYNVYDSLNDKVSSINHIYILPDEELEEFLDTGMIGVFIKCN